MTIVHKYFAALLHVAIVLVTALTAALDKPLTFAAVLQIAVLVAGSIATYLVPVLDKTWQGIVKTGVGLLTAAVAALLPVLTNGHLTAQNVFIVVGAVLAALGTELGVQVRVDAKATAK